jgi:CRISPR-associated protein Csy2
MRKFLIISNIKIEEANAFSSPYTVGFPAIPAFAGFMHRMQRELIPKYIDLKFTKIGIICNDFDLRAYRDSTNSGRAYSVIEKRHPLKSDGKTDSFIEEPLCNLETTIVFEYDGVRKVKEESFIDDIEVLLSSKVKIASGNIVNFGKVFLKRIDDHSVEDEKKLLRMLNRGFAIVNRRDLIEEDMKQNNLNAFDSVLSFIQVNSKAIKNEDKVEWIRSKKNSSGWFVPISVGYQGISKLGHAENQRSNAYLHRFAESVVTLGEFVMPYRLNEIDKMLWHYDYDELNNLYLCK